MDVKVLANIQLYKFSSYFGWRSRFFRTFDLLSSVLWKRDRWPSSSSTTYETVNKLRNFRKGTRRVFFYYYTEAQCRHALFGAMRDRKGNFPFYTTMRVFVRSGIPQTRLLSKETFDAEETSRLVRRRTSGALTIVAPTQHSVEDCRLCRGT